MNILERTTEEIEIGLTKYLVCITHRETVWWLETKFSYLGVEEGRNVVVQGSTKEKAIRNLFLQIGFHAGVAAMKAHAQGAEPIDEHDI